MSGTRVGIGVLALAGCNQILGLDPVTVAPPQDISVELVPDPTVRLSYMIATANGGAPGALDLTTPLPDPMVKVGPLSGELAPVTYDLAARTIEFPRALLGTRWRLEYTDDSRTPHELQWTVADEAHVVVPHIGPLAPTPPAPGSGYRINPVGGGAPATFASGHLFSSGIWIDAAFGPAANPVTISLDGVVPLSGPPGVPAPTDSAALVDFQTLSGCTTAKGHTVFSLPPVSGTVANIVPNPAWNASTTPATLTYLGNFESLRLPASLESRTGVASSKLELGHGADERMPAFTRQDLASPALAEPGPVMLVLERCAFGATTVSPFSDPTNLSGFPYFAHASLRDERTVGSVSLVSSLSGVTTSPATNFTIATQVPIAHAPIRLADPTTVTTLSGTTDQVMFAAGSGQLDLTFNLDTLDPVDYFEVTVFRIDGAKLVPLRVYVSTDTATVSATDGAAAITTPIKLDRALFQSTKEYVLAIQTYRGRPRAGLGDFTQVSAVQAVATVFTRTLLVP